MPEAQRTKNWFQFNKGIDSESSELTMQDGFSTDEANYELLQDGSRKRRRAMTQEEGGASMTISSHDPTAGSSQSYVWRSAGSDSTKNFIVHRIGDTLYFTTDEDGGSASLHSENIDLTTLRLEGLTNSLADEPVDFSQGRGVLFIAGKYIFPTAIKYDPGTNTFSTEIIEIQIRDYEGIDDGVSIDEQVESGLAGAATLSDLQTSFADHYYNLLCRGWNVTDILDYENTITGTARFPAKQQWWVDGYYRQYGASIAEEDGTWAFDEVKMNAAIFGGTDAPLGSMIINVFDDTVGFKEISLNPAGTYTEITGGNLSAAVAGDPQYWDVTVTDASHTFNVGDTINWKAKPIMFLSGIPAGIPVVLGETSTVTDVSAGVSWTFQIISRSSIGVAGDAIFSNCSYWGFDPVARSSGTGPLEVAPTAIEFHGGRLFYAGIEDPTWSDYIFFSQVVSNPLNYKRCHTDADPTSRNFNQPVPTDGGYLIVPHLGKVRKMLSMNNSLLIFTDQGVWEIQGKGTFFDPTAYNVRKITESECGSPYSPIVIEDICVYTGPKGVYAIQPDRYTRQLEAQNISDDRIRTFWNKIGPTYEPRIATVYDDAKKRLIFFQPGTANQFENGALLTDNVPAIGTTSVFWILDFRIMAWYKYEFNQNTSSGSILHGFALTGQDGNDGKRKFKCVVQDSPTTCIICDMDDTGYQDFDGNVVKAVAMSAYDNINNMSRRKQAPIITVFSKRTETGYTLVDGEYLPVNPSSTTMTAYWDWTDDTVTGKVGSSNEVYRKVRNFSPSGPADSDGYPVVVTRNKVRGRGRVLQLRFESSAEADEDSHLLGYSIEYKVSRRK